jgi:hypothetical protein
MWLGVVAGLAGGIVAVAPLAPASGLTAAGTSGVAAAGQGVAAAPTVARGRDRVAVVTTPEASGRLLITVTSDAKRVLLTWCTAANTKRATIMRIHNGKAARYLPKGSTEVHAKALATGKLTPSPPVASSPTPSTTAGCARTIPLGQSVQGRAIVACRLRGSDDTAAHAVLVVGSIHGIEPAGLSVVARLQAMDITGRKANVWVIETINRTEPWSCPAAMPTRSTSTATESSRVSRRLSSQEGWESCQHRGSTRLS